MKRANCHFLNYSHILMKTLYQDGLLIKKYCLAKGGKSGDDAAE
ncbi:hypothetical protein CIT292_07721 [Citrobacter youngae ATCC 29220]|uniref:Uncharacterized protein n=1 Tax=Citrobacter youngae ATCC 29220 TaxID=500640 RepID=D4BB73_9ENTR|nr:hypothetical protein CIT292_07721 [Citrobacter youngae ATCC 29220]